MKYIYTTLILLTTFVSVYSQLYTAQTESIYVGPGGILYSGIDVRNTGAIIFTGTAATAGDFYFDKNYNNSSAEGRLILGDATLHFGAGGAASTGSHTANFNNSNPSGPSFNEGEVIAQYVELNKLNGTLTVGDDGDPNDSSGLLSIIKSFKAQAGTLEANDNVVLRSSSMTETAIVLEKTTATLAAVNNIRVERYIPGNRKWRLMASPVTTDATDNQSIWDTWQQKGLDNNTASSSDPDAGYQDNLGTHITGGPDGNTTGYDVNLTKYPSLYEYDLANQAYTPIKHPVNLKTKPLEVGEAYLILIRGDRSVRLNMNDAISPWTKLVATGDLQIGDYAKAGSLIGREFSVIANPYQAPVNMNQVLLNSNNIKSNFTIYDPTIGPLGGYVTYDQLSGNTNVPESSANQFLQPGQSAVVETIPEPFAWFTSINFEESHKGDLGNALTAVFREGPKSEDGYLRLGLYKKNAKAFTDVAYDGFILNFGAFNNSSDDLEDATKVFSGYEALGVKAGDDILSINARSLPTELNEVIDLHIENLKTSSYKFSVDLEGFGDLPEGIILWDKYTDVYTELSNLQTIDFDIDTSIPESKANNRFALVFENVSLGIDDMRLSGISLYPNPVFSESLSIQFSKTNMNVDTEVNIYTLLGQRVFSKSYDNVSETITLNNLNFSTGVYIVRVKQDNGERSFKIIKE
jgi:hypothetical protein